MCPIHHIHPIPAHHPHLAKRAALVIQLHDIASKRRIAHENLVFVLQFIHRVGRTTRIKQRLLNKIKLIVLKRLGNLTSLFREPRLNQDSRQFTAAFGVAQQGKQLLIHIGILHRRPQSRQTPQLHPGLNRRLKAWVRHQVPELVTRQVKERQSHIRVVIAGYKPMPELEKVRRQFWGEIDFVAVNLAVLKQVKHCE